MKFIFVMAMLMASNFASAAGVTVFTGTSSWTKSSCVDFSELEQLGVERSAEKNGMMDCQKTGATDCVIISANTGFCNCYRCDGQAVIRGTKP